MVDYQIHDQLLGEAGVEPEVDERHVVPGVGLILQIVTLAKPRVLESHGGGRVVIGRVHPSVQSLLGDARVQVDSKRGARKLRPPVARRLLLRGGIGDVVVIDQIREIAQVEPVAGLAVQDHVLRLPGVLTVSRAGNAEDARQIRQALVRPTVLLRIDPEHGVPPAQKLRHVGAVVGAIEHVRLLEQPP